jgi:hypothetical protein
MQDLRRHDVDGGRDPLSRLQSSLLPFTYPPTTSTAFPRDPRNIPQKSQCCEEEVYLGRLELETSATTDGIASAETHRRLFLLVVLLLRAEACLTNTGFLAVFAAGGRRCTTCTAACAGTVPQQGRQQGSGNTASSSAGRACNNGHFRLYRIKMRCL